MVSLSINSLCQCCMPSIFCRAHRTLVKLAWNPLTTGLQLGHTHREREKMSRWRFPEPPILASWIVCKLLKCDHLSLKRQFRLQEWACFPCLNICMQKETHFQHADIQQLSILCKSRWSNVFNERISYVESVTHQKEGCLWEGEIALMHNSL